MKIQKLQKETLSQAVHLRNKVFPLLEPFEEETLEASVYPEKFAQWFSDAKIKTIDYWISVTSNDVSGLVGLYTEVEAKKSKVWLGWYCVDPLYREAKIGSKLLDFALQQAKGLGYKELHLYTTDDEEYAKARFLYEKRGFMRYKESKKNQTVYYKIFLDKMQ